MKNVGTRLFNLIWLVSIGLAMAWSAKSEPGFCSRFAHVCRLIPNPAGLYLFFVSIMILLFGVVEATLLFLGKGLAEVESALRSRLRLLLLTIMVGGGVLLFYLSILAIRYEYSGTKQASRTDRDEVATGEVPGGRAPR
jgi:hypothetical protein